MHSERSGCESKPCPRARGPGQSGVSAQVDLDRGREPAQVVITVGSPGDEGRLRDVHLHGHRLHPILVGELSTTAMAAGLPVNGRSMKASTTVSSSLMGTSERPGGRSHASARSEAIDPIEVPLDLLGIAPACRWGASPALGRFHAHKYGPGKGLRGRSGSIATWARLRSWRSVNSQGHRRRPGRYRSC